MKRLAVLVSLLLLAPAVAFAQFSPTPVPRAVVAVATTVPNSVPLVVVVGNADPAAYLVVKTTAEVATASLVVTVALDSDLGDQTLCTMTAVTTNTTSLALLGSSMTAAGAVLDACDFPVAGPLSITFTVSGVGASFDVEADLHPVTSSW